MRKRGQGDDAWINLNNYVVSVTGINEVDVARIKTKLSLATIKTLEVTSPLSEVSDQDFDNTGIANIFTSYDVPTNGVVVKYSHNAINRDGTLDFVFTISKEGETATITITVTVTGIDESYVDSTKAMIEGLQLKTLILTSPLGEVTEQDFDNTGNAQIFTSYTPPTNGVEVKYSHGAISSDGTFDFTFTISIRSIEKTVIISVAVAGIDVAQVRAALENLPTTAITHVDHIAAVPDWTSIDDYLFSDIIKKTRPSLSTNIEAQYRILDALNEDGDLTVEFRMRKRGQGDDAWINLNNYVVSVTGINEADVARIKTKLSLATTKTLEVTSLLSEVNDQDFDNTGTANIFTSYDVPTNGLEVKYSHDAINRDGTLVFTLTFSKGSITDSITRTITVLGIDQAIAKEALEGLPTTPIHHTNHIPAVTNWTNADDDFFTNIIKKQKPDYPSTIELQYRILNALTADGELTVEFHIRKQGLSDWTQINDYVVSVSGINEVDVASMKEILEGLTLKETLSVTNGFSEVRDRNFNNTGNANIFTSYSVPIEGVKVKYSRDALNTDENVDFTLTISKGSVSDTITKTIFVQGVDQGKAKLYLEGLTKKLFLRGSNVPTPNKGFLDENNARRIFTFANGESYSPPSNVSIYYLAAALDVNHFIITFTITRNQPTTTSEMKFVWSFTLQDGTDVKKVYDDLVKLTPQTLVVTGPLSEVTNQNFNNTGDNQIFGSSYTAPTNGVKIKYSHGALNSDGTVNFTLTINKGMATKTLTKRVAVRGINQGNAKTYLEGLTLRHYQLDDSLPTSSSGTLSSDNAEIFFTFSSGASYSSFDNVVITYQVSEIENYEFSVTFTITTNISPSIDPVSTSRVYYVGDHDVNQVYDYLENLTLRIINTTNKIPEVDNKQIFNNSGTAWIFAEYSLPNDKVTVKYTHPLIDYDGKWAYTLYIEKGDISRTLVRMVGVEGISLLSASDYIRSLTPKKFDQAPSFPEIDESWTETFDASAAAKFFSDDYVPPKGATIKYWWYKWNNKIYLEFLVDVWKSDNSYKKSQLVQIIIPIGG